ncbi:uncharacterized protein FA14DRAFT_157291 [Meira miltonrushii]|uniref:Uncharacterized protein n=1 Tax=Meira miltonrushii TaxID=1280837 RepID=A0A316V7Y5_9BASI|nr:uncharacterized protein FA14DRAFT_157291 [Meira miltonrushii]PWN32581.1 hypothetical protein FA14DRAFT_157291 [Meira miltonrushii]
MDFKRISIALKKARKGDHDKRPSTSSSSKRSNFRRQALYGFADSTGFESNGALYAESDPSLVGDARYQFELLAVGNKKFADLAPIRGTLNEEKLDYFTWRLHHLFVDQLDRDRMELHDQDNLPQRSESNSSSFSSNSAHSSREERHTPMATAMERMADLGISEPGWVTMQNYRQMTQEEKRTSYRHAIVTSDALAAVPLLECEERHFVIAEEEQRRDECDSLFDHFYDAKPQQKPVVDVRDAGDEEATKPLPPPLLPASMFYRASFGIRQKPSRKTSSKSIHSETDKVSKLRTFFKAPLLRRADSEGAHTSVYVK